MKLPLASLVGLFVIFFFGMPWLVSIHEIKTQERKVALTFDDGPNLPYTDQFLELLSTYGARGTFFVLGRNLEMYPAQVKKIAASGHQLGIHGYSHQLRTSLSPQRQVAEVRRTQQELERQGLVGPFPFRPPYGKVGPFFSAWAWANGLKIYLWSDEGAPNDYSRKDPRVVAEKLASALRPGAILLLHDGEGTRSENVQTLRWLLEHMKAEGYQSVTLSELANLNSTPE